MAHILDGWNLWDSDKNLQYLLDNTCDSGHGKTNEFQKLATSNNENHLVSSDFNSIASTKVINDTTTPHDDFSHNFDNNDLMNLLYNNTNVPLPGGDATTASFANTFYIHANPPQNTICSQSSETNNVGTTFYIENAFMNFLNDGLVNINGNSSIPTTLVYKESNNNNNDNTNNNHNDNNNNDNSDGICIDVPLGVPSGLPMDSTGPVTTRGGSIIFPQPLRAQRQERSEGCYPCDICGSKLSTKYNLKKHISITHQTDKPFVCDVCGRTFKRKGELKTHKLTHSDEKPFQCNFCEKRFKRNGDLTEHMVIHNDGKPYACETCGNRFTQYSTLRTHILTHSGENPFSCDICGKMFSVHSNLTGHKLTHSREQPFECDICGRRFSLKGNLKRHIADIH